MMRQNGWKLIYEDAAVLVVCKEPGVATQSGNFKTQDLVSRLKNYRNEKGEIPEIFLIHRLDQPVGGLLVFGKTKQAAAALGSQVQKGTMGKYYRSVVEGVPKSKGRLEHYLLQDKKQNLAKVTEAGTKEAKKAVLEYKTLAVSEGRALLEIRLETGRFHQIRAQMAAIGHPVAGDNKYNGNMKEKQGNRKIYPALFAYRLVFSHPVSGKRMEFEEIPEYGFFCGFPKSEV